MAFFMEFFDIFAWKNSKNINVYIPAESTYSQAMEQCFKKWEEVTQHNISFHYINDKEIADIEVIFKSKFDSNEIKWYDFDIGRTTLQFSDKPKMTINIVQKDNAVGRYLKDDEIINIMLHEIGHSIGLWKHSCNKKSVMYAEIDKETEQKILKEDIARLSKIYKF